MQEYLITFRSITYAQRGERLLQSAGLRCFIRRTPKWMSARGCGYCVHLYTKDIAGAVQMIKNGELTIGKVYRQLPGGRVEEVEP